MFDDKCPFIFNDFMVFASNRQGGYGGYDLYYSIWNNGKWSLPLNFGNRINTRYDECGFGEKNSMGFGMVVDTKKFTQ